MDLSLEETIISIEVIGKTWDLSSTPDWNYITKHSVSQRDGVSFPFDVWLYHARYHQRIHRIIPNAARYHDAYISLGIAL